MKDWIVFDDADEVIIDMLTGEDVDDVVDDLLAEEGDDDQSDDEAAAVAGPTNSETFATLNEKARAAGQAAFAAQHSSWTAIDAAPESRAAEADAEAQAGSVALVLLQGESA